MVSRSAASQEEEEESCSQDPVLGHTRTEETLPFQSPEQFYFLFVLVCVCVCGFMSVFFVH